MLATSESSPLERRTPGVVVEFMDDIGTPLQSDGTALQSPGEAHSRCDGRVATVFREPRSEGQSPWFVGNNRAADGERTPLA